MMNRLMTVGALPALVLAAGIAGCSQNTERAGSADSQSTPPAAKPAAASAAAPSGGEGANGIAWSAPAGWIKEQPASQMRAAQYRLPSGTTGVKDAEMAAFYFGAGQGGQTQANLERWAGQFIQPDGSEPMKNAKIGNFATSTGLKVTTIELRGHYQSGGMGGPSYDEPGWKLFGAVVEGSGGPWFFKTVGPEAVIDKQHGSILEFLKGLRTTR